MFPVAILTQEFSFVRDLKLVGLLSLRPPAPDTQYTQAQTLLEVYFSAGGSVIYRTCSASSQHSQCNYEK